MKTKNKIMLSFATSIMFITLISSTGCSDGNAYYGKMQAKINAIQSALNKSTIKMKKEDNVKQTATIISYCDACMVYNENAEQATRK